HHGHQEAPERQPQPEQESEQVRKEKLRSLDECSVSRQCQRHQSNDQEPYLKRSQQAAQGGLDRRQLLWVFDFHLAASNRARSLSGTSAGFASWLFCRTRM